MLVTKKLTTVGNGLGVLIDKPIVEKMNLEKGDFLELRIKKVE